MSARDSLEMETRDIPAPNVPREQTLAEIPEQSPRGRTVDNPDSRAEASAELRQRVDGDWKPGRFDAPRDELARFDPERAGLPTASVDSAAEYLAKNREARPWLAAADAASPEARRVIAAIDAGDGHGHIRHEGWITEEANRRRVAYLEDPAQLDPAKQKLGVDGLRSDDQAHRCGSIASRVANPDAFAAAFSRGVEHPKVREALNMAFDPDNRPDVVTMPIADLLGPDGHKHCTGWQLQPVDGSMRAARKNRDAWATARAEGRTPDVPEPQAVPVPTFEGGVMTFMFARKEAERRYEVGSMYPDPPSGTRQAMHPIRALGEA